MKQRIQIVTHCFCPPGIDVYQEHLKWQVASLLQHTPAEATVQLSVCFTAEDLLTTARIRQCIDLVEDSGVQLDPICLEPSKLFRRSIGRNIATLRADADIFWFADVDYLFGAGCLDAVAAQADHSSLLLMPQEYYINYQHDEELQQACDKPHHELGRQMVERERHNRSPRIDPSEFKLKTQRTAIGGMQIVGGDFCRDHGYLRDSEKWQTPVDARAGFRSCRCDAAFRRRNHLQATRIPIPNLFRLRHADDGRDYDHRGRKKGKDVW